ncbi:MAG: hypothetical protein RI908_374 [Actinomycetota bacterium]|jgi:hypothetical protein
MTIERGANWGEVVERKDGDTPPTPDLSRELGNTVSNGHIGPWLRLPLDVVDIVALDSRGRRHERSTISWVTMGRWIHGEYTIVSSTSFVAGRRIFSRAHPNDGRLDWLVVDEGMSLRQRVDFRRRTRSESHLPHPLVSVGTGSEYSRTFTRPATLRFENDPPLRGILEVTVTVRPDAAVTHIPAR